MVGRSVSRGRVARRRTRRVVAVAFVLRSMDGAEDGAEGGDPLQDIVMVDPYEEQDSFC